MAPTQIEGNPTCQDLNPNFKQLKIDGVPGNGTYSNAGISVTISNVGGDQTFDWTSNHSIDVVMVKAATHVNVYTYNPESYGDKLLDSPGKYAISHVNFCYDAGDYTPPTPPGGGGGNPPSNNPGGGSTTTPTDGQTVSPSGDSGSQPSETGSQVVLGERIGAVSARLLAPNGCVARTFNARVRGAGIAGVVFKVDGKRVKTVKKGGVFAARVNPAKLKVGVHRIVATVKFEASRHQNARTLRSSFQRCASRFLAPRFTG